MCNPASAGLLAGGAAASYAGKRRADRAMTSRRAAERVRQQGLQQEADTVWQGALPQMGAEAAQQGMETSQARRAASEAALAGPQIVLPMMGGNRAVEAAAASEGAQQQARTAAMGAARRRLDGFGDAMLEQGLVQQDAGQRIGTVNSFRRGSMSVLPHELQAAANRGAGLQMLGSVLSTLGTGAAFSAGAAGAAPWWDQLRGLTPRPAAAPAAGIPGGAELAAAYLRG